MHSRSASGAIASENTRQQVKADLYRKAKEIDKTIKRIRQTSNIKEKSEKSQDIAIEDDDEDGLLKRQRLIYEADCDLAFVCLWEPFEEGILDNELIDKYLDLVKDANSKRVKPKLLPPKTTMQQAYQELLQDKDTYLSIDFTPTWQRWDVDQRDPEAAALRRAEENRINGNRKFKLPSTYEEARRILIKMPKIPPTAPYYNEMKAAAKKIVRQHMGLLEHKSVEVLIAEVKTAVNEKMKDKWHE